MILHSVVRLISLVVPVCMVLSTCMCGEVYAITDPLKYKRIKLYKSPLVDTQFPVRSKVHTTKDINYRLSILPEKRDRFMNAYVVVPQKGIVAPVIIEPKTSQRYKDTLAGKQPDFTKDLNRGIFHYPWTPWPQALGNGVYFAHTSQFADDKSKYGTIWQAFARLDPSRPRQPWDYVYYYKKIQPSQWLLYEYEIVSEKRIKDTDTTLFHQDLTKRQISFVWCVDWWTSKDRRVTKWTLKKVSMLVYSTGVMSIDVVYPVEDIRF